MYTPYHLLSQVDEAVQDTYITTQSDGWTLAGNVTALLIGMIFVLAVIIFAIWASCKLFQKAGRKWWEALVPFYNTYVMLKIVGRPGWWLLLYFIPFVSIVVGIINTHDLSKSFGRGVGTTLLLLFFPIIMYPLMAFSSKYQYTGPAAAEVKPIPDTPYPTNTTSQSNTSDTTGPQPPTSTEPAPTAPETPTSTPPDNATRQ